MILIALLGTDASVAEDLRAGSFLPPHLRQRAFCALFCMSIAENGAATPAFPRALYVQVLVHHMEHELYDVHSALQKTLDQLFQQEQESEQRIGQLEMQLSKQVSLKAGN